MVTKQLWYVAADKDTLWVKWINTFKLKGKSVWEVNEDISDTWGWRNILRMRQEVRKYMFMSVGDGSKTSMWFDSWSNLGALNEIISYRGLYDARLQINMTVKDFCDRYKGQWNDRTLGNFSVRDAYYDLQCCYDNVNWNKLVWFSQNVPKHAFILWLAIQGSLTTQDKIRNWIKEILALKIIEKDWKDTVNEFAEMQNGNTIRSVVRRLCLAASVYLIWQERNNRLTSLKVKRSQAVINTEKAWDMKMQYPNV
ncbi:RNA-directed DNA polymerase, eukaryota, reverse transcriptase zinc-binding domain protein [Tanacetum coccineum]